MTGTILHQNPLNRVERMVSMGVTLGVWELRVGLYVFWRLLMLGFPENESGCYASYG